MEKVLPEANLVALVEQHLAEQTPEVIQLRRATEDVLATIRAVRKIQPSDESDNFPFYSQSEE